MKNIILTGERGIGKSTLTDKIVSKTGMRAAGLKTLFREKRDEPHSCLFASSWGEEPLYDSTSVIARFGQGLPEALTEVFNTLCAGLIDEAVRNEAVEIIVIDELGFLEKDALLFKKAVMRAMSCPKPVIAVIRQGLPAWTAEAAKEGSMFVVTVDNRDELIDLLVNALLQHA